MPINEGGADGEQDEGAREPASSPPQENFDPATRLHENLVAMTTIPAAVQQLAREADAASFPQTPLAELERIHAGLKAALDTCQFHEIPYISGKAQQVEMLIAFYAADTGEEEDEDDEEGEGGFSTL